MAPVDHSRYFDCLFMMKMPPVEMFESQPRPYLKECTKPDQHGPSDETNCTIGVRRLKPWMDEDYLYRCFSQTGEEVVAIEINGRHRRCAFIEFTTHEAAWRFMMTCKPIFDLDDSIPNTGGDYTLLCFAYLVSLPRLLSTVNSDSDHLPIIRIRMQPSDLVSERVSGTSDYLYFFLLFLIMCSIITING
ncbi:hypothetical protein M5689_020555 [Euphorbia peplus]|nr:hypothetical protein M5689_020555 [Euphorbia peplus]